MNRFDDFIQELDASWSPPEPHRLPLRIIGSTALMLQTSYERGTKDTDILETAALPKAAETRLISLAGHGTALHRRHRMYLDIVRHALPFLPEEPVWHADTALSPRLSNFTIYMLDPVDVVVSKLKRFNHFDQEDIRAMIELEVVEHAALIDRFCSAVAQHAFEARAEDMPGYVANLHRLERDEFCVEETQIELPSWIA